MNRDTVIQDEVRCGDKDTTGTVRLCPDCQVKRDPDCPNLVVIWREGRT